jgi:hypothetical protein
MRTSACILRRYRAENEARRWEHEEMTESLHGHDDTPGGKS